MKYFKVLLLLLISNVVISQANVPGLKSKTQTSLSPSTYTLKDDNPKPPICIAAAIIEGAWIIQNSKNKSSYLVHNTRKYIVNGPSDVVNPDVKYLAYKSPKGSIDFFPVQEVGKLLSEIASDEAQFKLLSKQLFNDISSLNQSKQREFLFTISNNTELLRAWDVCLADATIRMDLDELVKVSDYLKNNPTKASAFKTEFDALPADQRALFVDRTSALEDFYVKDGPFSWDNFDTNGFNPANAPQSLKQEIFDALDYPPDVAGKWKKVDEFIKSGGTPTTGLAVGVDLPVGTELVKITRHVQNNPNLGPSAYWMTRDAFKVAKSQSINIEDFLGLPAQSISVRYDVISVKTVAKTRVYKSTIASTTQGAFSTVGGGEQMIVPNVNSTSFGPRVMDKNYIGWMPKIKTDF